VFLVVTSVNAFLKALKDWQSINLMLSDERVDSVAAGAAKGNSSGTML